MITLTERERSFLFSLLNDLYQNWNSRSLEPELLKGLLGKLQSCVLSLSEQESRRVQVLVEDTAELYSRIADPRLQHILNTQNSQGFGRDHGNTCSYFDGAKTYQLCQTILKKLTGS